MAPRRYGQRGLLSRLKLKGAEVTPNVALMRRTLEHILKNRELWDQSDWGQDFQLPDTDGACGTKFCFAGWAVQLSGGKFPVHEEQGFPPYHDYDEVLLDSLPENVQARLEGGTGLTFGQRIVGTDAAATALFGVTPQTGNQMYSASNTIGHLKLLVAHQEAKASGGILSMPWHPVVYGSWEDDHGYEYDARAECEEGDDCMVQAYILLEDTIAGPEGERGEVRLVLGGDKIRHETKEPVAA